MKFSSYTRNFPLFNRSKILTAIASICSMVSLLLPSCSDDLSDFRSDIKDSSSISFNFVIPVTDHIVTRADDYDNGDERKVSNIVILVFSSDGKIIQRQDLNNIPTTLYDPTTTREFPYTLNLNSEAQNDLGKTVYAIANTDIGNGDLLSAYQNGSDKTITDLEKEVASNYMNPDTKALIMSGKLSTEESIIYLSRSAAKITVKDCYQKNEFKLIDYYVWYTAEKCYLTAATSSNNVFYPVDSPAKDNKIHSSEITLDGDYRYDCYVNPTRSHLEDGVTATVYVVIQAKYNEEICYYALPIYDNDSKTFFDIKPNHWYDMRITGVNSIGSSSEENAIKNHNFNQITVQIHDHAPDVLSMVSDGTHELGVSRNISLSNNETAILYVKCFSADSDIFNINDLTLTVTEGDEWIQIVEPLENPGDNNYGEYKYSYHVVEPNDSYYLDPDDAGVQLQFTVKVRDGYEFYAEETGNINVSYRGLERDVSVTYKADFTVNEVCDAVLYIFNMDQSQESRESYYSSDYATLIGDDRRITDYWTFIKGEGSGKEKSSGSLQPKLWGIDSEMLVDGKIRTHGFHFPMPYGKSHKWEYEYKVDFSKLVNNDKSKIDNITCKIGNTSDSFIKNYIGYRYDSNTKDVWLYLKDGGKYSSDMLSSYQYAGGNITFHITFTDDTPKKEITVSLYHTGFFHFEGNQNYVPNEDYGYYYYEVKPLIGKGESLYWLDRNLGAQSNLRYVDNGNSLKPLGEPSARGRYLTISDPKSDETLYSEPTFDEFMANICPPGYHIPTTSEWNEVRLSDNFITESQTFQEETFITSYYNVGNDKIGNVFFPKARFYQDANTGLSSQKFEVRSNSGDSESGYYWTSTEAPGMEKQNMGNWLRALYINGTSTTYNNASISDHKLPVRLVAGVEPPSQKDNYISFNVHNVTHVYIFDGSTGSPLYPFPGKAVGSNESSQKWQYFNCTTTVPLQNLYAIFTHMDDNGVTVFSRNGDSFVQGQKLTDIMKNVEENAWSIDIILKRSLDFCIKGADRDNNIGNSNFSDCGQSESHDSSDPSKKKGGESDPISDPFKAGDIINFYWPVNYRGGYPNILAWNWTTAGNYCLMGDLLINQWKGYEFREKVTWEDVEYYKYTVNSLPQDIKEFSVATIAENSNISGKSLQLKIKHDSQTEKYYIEHQSNATQGGSITRTSDGSPYTWNIFLYDPLNSSEQVIWEGEIASGNYRNKLHLNNANTQTDDIFTYQYFDWNSVSPDIIFKVYYNSTGNPDVQFFNGNSWNQLNVTKRTEDLDNNGYKVTSILIDNSLLNNLINNNGLVIQGNNFTFLSVSIMPDDGSFESGGGNQGSNKTYDFNPSENGEQIIWEGTHNENWNGFNIDWIKWNDVPYGSYITIYYTNSSDWWGISLRANGDDGWGNLPDNYFSESKPENEEPLKIPLIQSALDLIRQKGYLKITGMGFTMTRLTMSTPTTN